MDSCQPRIADEFHDECANRHRYIAASTRQNLESPVHEKGKDTSIWKKRRKEIARLKTSKSMDKKRKGRSL